MLNFTCINSFNLTTTAKPSGVSTHVTLRLLRLLGNEVLVQSQSWPRVVWPQSLYSSIPLNCMKDFHNRKNMFLITFSSCFYPLCPSPPNTTKVQIFLPSKTLISSRCSEEKQSD